MRYNYYYRIGLLIQREGKIDVVSAKDLVNLYSSPSKETFQPIPLTDDVLDAFGFRKSKEKIKGYYCYYSRYDLYLSRRPFARGLYCPNLQSSPDMKFLHELQDFLRFIPPFHIFEKTRLQDFIFNYGSRNLCIFGQ